MSHCFWDLTQIAHADVRCWAYRTAQKEDCKLQTPHSGETGFSTFDHCRGVSNCSYFDFGLFPAAYKNSHFDYDYILGCRALGLAYSNRNQGHCFGNSEGARYLVKVSYDLESHGRFFQVFAAKR